MTHSSSKDKVILGLSGGVDSTAAALLLQEKGLTVIGLYFDITEGNDKGRKAAKDVADQLGIQFVYKNVHDLFSHRIISNFCEEYIRGRTPNPCILCNPTVKFKTLLDEADCQGAHYIATGHYAKSGYSQELGWTIRKAKNEKKDQSYMLYRLKEDVISRLLLPLGDISSKEEIRQIARNHHLSNAELKDSQEICFIDADSNYASYIKEKGYTVSGGDFVDELGKTIGHHNGLIHYTIGQRKGLGITFGKPVFVTKINADTNTITLGDNESLLSNRIISENNTFAIGNIPDGLAVSAKIRYAAKPAKATITYSPDGTVETIFENKQRAATPGQSIVFYKGDSVIGGGMIR